MLSLRSKSSFGLREMGWEPVGSQMLKDDVKVGPGVCGSTGNYFGEHRKRGFSAVFELVDWGMGYCDPLMLWP